MVILIDGSEKTEGALWNITQNIILDLVDNLRVKEDLVRVGVAQFSSTYKKEFYLNELYEEKDKKEAIKKMTPLKETRNIGAALNAVQEFFQTDKGSRIEKGISQNLLLITFGKSSDDVTGAADGLKAMGIKVFAIGATGKNESNELASITGSHDNIFLLDSFAHHALNRKTQMVIDAFCKPDSDTEGKATLEYKVISQDVGPFNSLNIMY